MEHFNGLTPEEHERLTILMEEMGESIQAIGKIFRHGYETSYPKGAPTNRQTLEKELGHVSLAIARLIRSGDIDSNAVAASMDEKTMTIGQWLHHHKEN
jgi:NTP pyrophosphatase (non-canonical NTP hydrolase)